MSSRPTVLLTNAIHADGEALLKPHANLVIAADTRPETLRAAVRDVDGVIVRAQLPDDIADNAPRLKGLVRHGVGLDFIPVDNATRNGVMVANLPGMQHPGGHRVFLRSPTPAAPADRPRSTRGYAPPMAGAAARPMADTSRRDCR